MSDLFPTHPSLTFSSRFYLSSRFHQWKNVIDKKWGKLSVNKMNTDDWIRSTTHWSVLERSKTLNVVAVLALEFVPNVQSASSLNLSVGDFSLCNQWVDSSWWCQVKMAWKSLYTTTLKSYYNLGRKTTVYCRWLKQAESVDMFIKTEQKACFWLCVCLPTTVYCSSWCGANLGRDALGFAALRIEGSLVRIWASVHWTEEMKIHTTLQLSANTSGL